MNGPDQDDGYVGSLDEQLGVAVRTGLALAYDGGEDQECFTKHSLAKVAQAVVYQMAIDEDVASDYEDLIADSVASFVDVPINEKYTDQLVEIIRHLVEPVLSQQRMYDVFAPDEEDDNVDDTELIDQIGNVDDTAADKLDTALRRRGQIQITDSITSTSNASETAREEAVLYAWMERAMSKTEQEYLAEEQANKNKADAKATAYRHDYSAKGGCKDDDSDHTHESVDEVRRLPECKNSSSSSSDDDTLHSEGSVERRNGRSAAQDFQSPEPYQIRKSAHAASREQEGGAVGEESLPAWLMPKSPLDAHFRTAYGFVGKPDMEETIAELTSTQKKALRASRIADDHERLDSDEGSARSSQRGQREDDEEDSSQHTDTRSMDDDLPAWLMPKSPLDAHFRKGYGGIGQGDFQESVEVITTAQKKARAAMRAQKRRAQQAENGRLYSDSDSGDGSDPDQNGPAAEALDSEGEFDVLQENIITVDDLPDNFGHRATALNPTTVGTPEHTRPSRTSSAGGSGGAGSGGNRSRGSEYAKQTKLFQSPNPSKIRVTVSARKSGTKEAVQLSEDPAPAWEIPKSPLDAHFRKSYGGVGHAELQETVQEVTTAQKKARAAAAQQVPTPGKKDGSVIRMLDKWFAGKRGGESAPSAADKLKAVKGGLKKPTATSGKGKSKNIGKNTKDTAPKTRLASRKAAAAKTTGSKSAGVDKAEASEQIMFNEESNSFIDAELDGDDHDGDHLLPSAHEGGARAGNAALTGNRQLNEMIQASFQAHLAQYASEETKQSSEEHKSPSASNRGSEHKSPAAARANQDLDAILASPHLQHSMEQIDRMIKANMSKLRKMQSKEKALRDSFSSGVSLTDDSAEAPPRRKEVRATKQTTKQSKRDVSSYLIAPSAATVGTKKKAASKAKKMVHSKSTTDLHLRMTGNLKPSAAREMGNVLTSSSAAASRRSSRSTTLSAGVLAESAVPKSYSSKISAHLLSLHNKPTASSGARYASPSARRASSISVGAGSLDKSPGAAADGSPKPASRPLSRNSRLLAPTASALIRAADIATNSSKTANIHNEWHLHLRSGDVDEADVELSERKLRNTLIRHSLPAGDADRILEWSSPDRKSKSVDYSLGIKNHALHVLDNSALDATSPFSTPQRSPSPVAALRRRRSDPVYIAPLPRDSRLTAPTVATVMRSLDAAQQSPVIQRLQKELQQQPSKAYLFRGPKFAKNLVAFQQGKASRKQRKGRKKRRGSKTSATANPT